MVITAEGKLQNVKASIEEYIDANLVKVEGLVIDWEGTTFEVANRAEWIQERILGLGEIVQHRHVGVEKGRSCQVMLNFNVFVNRELTTKSNRQYKIRDLIFKYFNEGAQIDLYDYEGGNFTTSLQKMTVRETITDQPIPDETYWQYNVTVGIHWIQKWT